MEARPNQELPNTILDNLSDGIILLDFERLITKINLAALSMMEIDLEAALGKPLKQFFDLPAELFDPTDVLPHLHLPVSIQHKSGLDLDFELTLHPTNSGWLLVLRDASKEHQIRVLNDRQKYLSTALANTTTHFLVLDQNRRLLYANAPLLRLTGLETSDWTAFSWLSLGANSTDSQHMEELLNEALTTGGPTWGEISLETALDQIHYEAILCPVETGSVGISLVVVTLSDITQHQQLQEELSTSRDFYHQIFSEAPDPIVITDSKGKVTLVSPRFLELFQIRADIDILGTPILSLFAPQEHIRAQENLDLILKGFRDLAPKGTLFTLQRKDNQQFIGEINARTFKASNGLPSGLIVTIRDASEREQERVELNHANEMLIQTNHELEKHNFMVTNLNEMGQALLACDGVDNACQVLANTSAKLFTRMAGAIFLKGPNSDLIKLTSAWGENPYLENDIDLRGCPAIQSKSTRFFCVPPLNKRSLRQKQSNDLEGPQVCFPLIVQDEVIGVFQLHGKPQEVHDTWMQIAGSMADKFALTVANLRLRDKLHVQAIRDPLTGLYNRRHMEESLNRELSRAKRHNHPVGIIMMDIDFFKVFNDTYLHDGGDALLRKLGRYYRSHTRGEDIACRYGGEEFTIILPETNLNESFERADLMRKQIGQIRLVHRGVHLNRVTISAGVSCYPIHGQTGDELLRAADTALYAAKNSGRNRTMLAIDPDNQ